MNTNILKLAIQGMVEPSVEHIATLISYLPEEQQENALMILAGIEHEPISATSNVDTNATLLAYNLLTGNVEYEYSKKKQECYKHDYDTPAEAQEAISNGTFVKGTKNQHYLFTGDYTTSTGSCSLKRWLNK